MNQIKENDIFELLHYGERLTLEVKSAAGGLPNSLWQTYSAFANTSGGAILLGIQENVDEPEFEKRFAVVELKDPFQLVKDFWNTINSNKVSVSILRDSDVQIVQYQGKSIVYINVPRADYRVRPVFINSDLMRGTYKRNYEGDYHCSETEIRAMLRDANDSGNDGILLDNYTIDDIDIESLKSYRNEYQGKNPEHVWNTLDNRNFLINLGGLARDRATGKEWLTVAGLMMFGKGLPIRERFDNIRMDYLDFTNLLPGSRWSDRLTYDGTWENNLYNFFRRVIPKLTADLKHPFRMEGIVRIDDTPVHKAIREAMVNMIIHCDLMLTGVLRVEKRDKSFVFINPGSLKLPIDVIRSGGNSKARNPRIQNMLRMIGFGEAIGSGFPTILSTWKAENWRSPDLRDVPECEQVELRLWMVSLLPQECTNRLHELWGDQYDSLTANEQIVLSAACLENEISNAWLQPLLELHPTDISKLLGGLTDKGYLICHSKGRWTTYSLNDQPAPQDNLFSSTTKADTTKADTTKADTTKADTTKADRSNTVKFSLRFKRLLDAVGNESLSAQELMKRCSITNRSYFGKAFLKPALKAGVLEMTYPDKPQTNQQRYRKAQSFGKDE